MQIERVSLPGIGTGYSLRLHDGQLLGVICYRDGQRELVFYDVADPDSVQRSLVLTSSEAEEVAQLLHASTTVTIEHIGALEDHMNSLSISGLPVPAGSAVIGRSLDDIGIKRRTGASIVAVLTNGHTVNAPGCGDLLLRDGDIIIAAGSAEQLGALAGLLTTAEL